LPDFPDSPISAAEFFEAFVPARIARAGLADAAPGFDLAWGVHLSGEGGGEWLYRLSGGEFGVSVGNCDAAAFKLIQSVDDWRGTLWEGRGGVAARKALAIAGSDRVAGFARAAGTADPDGDFVARLAELDGVLSTVVTDGPGGAWSLAVQFGPGPVPDEVTTTVTLSHADADALASGSLAPLEAFLAGRITISGDMLLMMQLQSLAAELAAARR
jgi:hypothetical protein